ncbi:MAG: hypothetical protein KAQ75_04470 [Bacteroidales bacterium]|nr:hypothetical protein [Bacteroidales bacterium]
MIKQITKLLILLSFLFLFQSVYCQITISKSKVDYSLKIEKDSTTRILTFWKDKDSTIYTSVKYSVIDFKKKSTEINLTDEISTINQLWNIAKDSITFNLQSFNIGYPLLYSDILKNNIQAFIDSKDWQNHIKQNGEKLDYNIIKKVMLDADVYQPLNDFLKTKGFYISGFETEKHGFVTKENLQKVSFTGAEIIPMPFIVWGVLSKL